MTMTDPDRVQPDYRSRLVEALGTIEQLRDELRQRPRLDEPIAVIGIGCRFPGGVDDPETYWQLLCDGVDAIREFPADRGEARQLLDEDPDRPGKAYCIEGGFLDGPVDRFEPAVFGISPREALGMDPQQRLVLQVAWEALERAGYAPDRLTGSPVGVYLGISTTDYVRMRQSEGDIDDVDAYQLVGEPSFAAGRISYTLGLQGPSKVIDTTCSSSLVSLHEACQALRLGECDMALAGGVNLMLSPYGFVLMSKFRALSPAGRCKTFDAAADGYVRGEGAGIVVLKRYADAVRDQDRVLAVVRGSAVNHDGRSSGLTVPNPAAQREVILQALRQANLTPAEVDYVEAHGTGTALGDPIELRALQAVIGSRRPADAPLLVGSVKTNIGHLESAAGIAGVIKLVLAIENGFVPPHLHLQHPNPNVDWSALNITVPTSGTAWASEPGRRVGGISSFGASGTNAHAVLSGPPSLPRSSAPAPQEPGIPVEDPGPAADVLVLSAQTEAGLRESARRWEQLLRDPRVNLADACHTSRTARARLGYGVAVPGRTSRDMAEVLATFAAGGGSAPVALPAYKYRKFGWLFSGQGSQYPGMAAGLRADPVFAEALGRCIQLFDELLPRPLADVLWPAGADRSVHDTRYTQPALFSVQYALATSWLSRGVRPDALLGHSIGEISAACVAGVLELPDAVRLVTARAALMAQLPSDGAMFALGCSEATARAAIGDQVDHIGVAAVNGPESVVVSGNEAALATMLDRLGDLSRSARRLQVSHAFHSPLLRPMLDGLRSVAADLRYRPPAIPLISGVTGQLWSEQQVSAEYWVEHAIATVRFHDAVRAMHDLRVRTFLEIGPDAVLTGLGRRALGDPETAWIPSLRRPADAATPSDDQLSFQRALGLLYLRGADPDWRPGDAGRPRRIVAPTTAWQGERYWFRRADPPVAHPAPAADRIGLPESAVPARRLPAAVPAFEIELTDPALQPLVAVRPDGLRELSLAGQLELAMSAAGKVAGGSWQAAREVRAGEPLLFDSASRQLQIVLTEDARQGLRFTCYSRSAAQELAGAPWSEHSRGRLARWAQPDQPPAEMAGLTEDATDTPTLSARWAGRVTCRRGRAGTVLLVQAGPTDVDLTGLFEIAAAAVPDRSTSAATVEEMTVPRPADVRRLWCRPLADPATFDVWCYDSDDRPVGGLRGLRLEPIPGHAPADWRPPGDLLQQVQWQQRDPDTPSDLSGCDYLVIGTDTAAMGLPAVLERVGARVTTASMDPVPIGSVLEDWLRSAGAHVDRRAVVLAAGSDAAGTVPAGRVDVVALAITQRLSRLDGQPPVKLVIVTGGAVAVRPGDRVTDPFARALWGLGRVIALEHPDQWGGVLDLEPSSAAEDDGLLCAALAAATEPDPFTPAREDAQALRGGRRWVPRLEPLAPPEAGPLPPVRADGSYLITGGFGGIGRSLARWLAAAGAGRIVLLGRRPISASPDGSAADDRAALVDELVRLGAEVVVLAADVCDRDQLSKAIAEADSPTRPLRGLFHAAGVSMPQFIRDIDISRPVEFDAVCRPKVIGGWLLHELTAACDLDFFVLFSSIAATWGSQHLAGYAAANAFLDALAEYRQANGLAGLAVSWGPWDLPSNLFGDDVLAFLTATGLRTLRPAQCLNLLGGLMRGPHAHAVVCAADWGTYKTVMQARSELPLLRTVRVEEQDGDSVDLAVVDQLDSAADDGQRREVMARYLIGVLADAMAVDPASITVTTDVFAMGIDSLLIMDIVKCCKRDLGVSIRPRQLFDRTGVEDWIQILLQEFGGQQAEPEPASGPDFSDPKVIEADVTLDHTIQPAERTAAAGNDPRHVLLTGATGFVGSYLLSELLASTRAQVHCLVRCADPAEGLARIRTNYERYQPWPAQYQDRIEVLPGDLARPLLGLTRAEFDRLAEQLDAIYHNGAVVNFAHTYQQARAANIGGTEEILRLACTGRQTRVSHVSTYGIWGLPMPGRSRVDEDADILTAGRLVTGYVQTKWGAERLVGLAQQRGIPVDVYRPGRVLGDSRTGACLSTHFTTRVIKGCIQLGLAPDLDLDIEMTPVDYVARALVAISLRRTVSGSRTYHLINGRKMRFDRLVQVLRARGWHLETVPVQDWWQALQDVFAERDNELSSVMEVVEQFIVGGEEALDYDASATVSALEGTGISCPPLDEKLLEVYLDWLVASGYLPLPVPARN